MPPIEQFKGLKYTAAFERDYKRLSRPIQNAVNEVITGLMQNPRPARLRFEKLRGYSNPGIYTVHVTPNHSHKLSFSIEDGVVILRRIGTHRKIDRSP